MIREFLSLPGSFLFLSGVALGAIVRCLPREASNATRQTAFPAWNDTPWGEITRFDGEAAFTPQLLNLHRALLHPQSPAAVACVGAKTRAPV